MISNQKTINKEINLSGIGLHTGAISNISFKPAVENTGIIFIRTDLNDAQIKADIDNVISTKRGTTNL